MKRWRTVVLILFLSPILALEVWLFLYPSKYDAKNARYVGWRLGLPTLSQEDALETMVADDHRDGLVLGKSQEELEQRFGFVTTLEETDAENKFCYHKDHKGEQVLFLRRSRWMVVMKDGRARKLFFLKGC